MAKKKTTSTAVPTYDELMVPTLKALIELGGSGTIEEINNRVYEILNLPDEILQIPQSEENGKSLVEYRLAWSRTYLKKFGLIENSGRGVWALVKHNIDLSSINSKEIKKAVQLQERKNKSIETQNTTSDAEAEILHEVEAAEDWKSQLLNVLYNISPGAFEKLAQRLLRENGFIQVEVTGKTGDGGIDGKGIVRINGFLSFHVIFQCKRYRGTISPSQIRDFRGAMQGRADKGLFITTGSFTRDALKEATRDGAPPLDLIDGDLLCLKLKELGLGVKTEMIEKVEIQDTWFQAL